MSALGIAANKKPTPFKMNEKRPSLQRYNASKPASATNAKYALLADSKKELADLQLELIKKEISMKEDVHKREMQLLDIKIKGQKLANKQLELADEGSVVKGQLQKREMELLDLKIENQRLQNTTLELNAKKLMS